MATTATARRTTPDGSELFGQPPQPAGAGSEDRHVGVGLGQLELSTDRDGLGCAAQALQAFVVAVQAPHVAGVLARPAQCAVEAEVGGVHLGGKLDVPLLEQQRTVGVPGRLHPAPRLVVGQRVVEFVKDPKTGRTVLELLPRFGTITYRAAGLAGGGRVAPLTTPGALMLHDPLHYICRILAGHQPLASGLLRIADDGHC